MENEKPVEQTVLGSDQCKKCHHTRGVHGVFSPPHTNDVPDGCAYCGDYCTAFVEHDTW